MSSLSPAILAAFHRAVEETAGAGVILMEPQARGWALAMKRMQRLVDLSHRPHSVATRAGALSVIERELREMAAELSNKPTALMEPGALRDAAAIIDLGMPLLVAAWPERAQRLRAAMKAAHSADAAAMMHNKAIYHRQPRDPAALIDQLRSAADEVRALRLEILPDENEEGL